MPSKSFEIAIVDGGIAGLTHGHRSAPTQHRRANLRADVAAMETCDGELDGSFGPGAKSAFSKVTNTNGWLSKQTVCGCAQQGVHRARFLDELVKVFPVDKTQLGKRLQNIVEREDGKLVLNFTDGTSAEADGVIGCDGIHSRVRGFIVDESHPSAHPSCSHKYAYRGIVQMETDIEAIGEEKTRNSLAGQVRPCAYLPNGRWEISQYGSLLRGRKQWAIFDTCENPLPIFFKGRIAVIGDAAQATSPHHGNGAGFAIEDSALIAELLADELVRTSRGIEADLATYEVRRDRDQWLVESSRFVGNTHVGLIPEIGTDYNKIHQEIKERGTLP
ncbi:salicylate hydroxylase [Talaromyces islandicus]|uniref:Salicylate hydroxylase n=1 Tax=Talaromyces islandicus TaxID=28573 RepID=A0A0U1LWD8_TALIS|nr:salicylate hydroxylase [Talaromyces islandicus]